MVASILMTLVKELKKFNSLDGYGIKMLLSSGFEVAVISSRSAPSVAHRMEGLGVKHCYQDQSDKNIKMQQILGDTFFECRPGGFCW